MFDDWVEEDLLDGPVPKGRRRGQSPLWEYPAGTTERALSILRLTAEHVTRFSALRLQLWLAGHELPPSRIKKDLESEFDRLLKKHFFRNRGPLMPGIQTPTRRKKSNVISTNCSPLIRRLTLLD
jgi:hypothetical protein